MSSIYLTASFWFLAAVISTILANRLKISIALMEIIIGSLIGFMAFKLNVTEKLALNDDWLKFCAGVGAIMLTFLSGAELNPDAMKSRYKEVLVIGLIGFFAPFTGCTLIAHFLVGWGLKASLLCGIALSTTSMAVVYSVMIEYGFNKTDYALVSIPSLLLAPVIFVVLFAGKVGSKILGLFPAIHTFKEDKNEKWYYTLLMSTGLTFGTISALYGLTHEIITQEQYSIIVGVVIASAVVPTLIANKFFLPSHLINELVPDDQIPDIRRKMK